MNDAHAILGLPADSDDETIRRRYLELVRQYPPEHHPQKFAEVRAAYERLKDLDTRAVVAHFSGVASLATGGCLLIRGVARPSGGFDRATTLLLLGVGRRRRGCSPPRWTRCRT